MFGSDSSEMGTYGSYRATYGRNGRQIIINRPGALGDCEKGMRAAPHLLRVGRARSGARARGPVAPHPRPRAAPAPASVSAARARKTVEPHSVLANGEPTAVLALTLAAAVLTGGDFASARLFCCLVTILAAWIIFGGRWVWRTAPAPWFTHVPPHPRMRPRRARARARSASAPTLMSAPAPASTPAPTAEPATLRVPRTYILTRARARARIRTRHRDRACS